ncbi:hypothetical protein TYRP_017563 [Tyrophagus putrescentiae]|nr:hypothetical protein TYRP_017563 [Tyrophagus putrescentiae]
MNQSVLVVLVILDPKSKSSLFLPSTNRRRYLSSFSSSSSSSSSCSSSSLLSPSPDSLVALPLVHPLVQPEEKTYVVGVEGARSVLSCNVTTKLNDTIDLILWFRGTEEKALYSIDARRAPTMQRVTKHFSGNKQLGCWAYIDLTTRDFNLASVPKNLDAMN